jgi:2-isopropylmalate synthase
MGSEQREISVFDSTLRDGEQAPGNAMSPEQKLALALTIEAIGVTTVETGFPSSSASDFKATQLISQALTTAKFATLNRATRGDINTAAEAGGVRNHQLQIMATGSDVHLKHKRGITRQDGIREIVDSFAFARSLGFTDITLGIEDASRGTDDLLHPLIDAALEGGAATVALADTTGCVVPGEMGELVAKVVSWVPAGIPVSVHCHNDLGLALPNALAAIEAGADEVQTTVAGIGERAGNTPLEELAAVLAYKNDRIGATTRINTAGLYEVFQHLCRVIGPSAVRHKPIFGDNVFATQAGIHQAGLLRNPVTYEYAEPERFGRQRAILVGRHSGRNILRYLLEQMGETADNELLDEVYREYIADRVDGDCVEIGELRQILGDRIVASRHVSAGAGS